MASINAFNTDALIENSAGDSVIWGDYVWFAEVTEFGTLLAERHHFRRPVAERVKRFAGFAAGASASKAVKRFAGFAAGASASKALTASATRKQALVEFWW